MYCPKCGKEINETAAFCPHCGEKMESHTEKRKKNGGARRPGSNPVSRPKKGDMRVLAALGIGIFLLAVLFLPGILRGKPDARALTAEYFAELEGSEEGEELCAASLRALISGVTGKTGVFSSYLTQTIEGALSSPAFLQEFGSYVSGYSSYEVEKIKTKGKSASAQVTVSYIDLSRAAETAVDDLVDNLSSLVSGGQANFLSGIDLDEVRAFYTGEISFRYDGDKKEWVLDQADGNLGKAYYGIGAGQGIH